MSRLEAVQMELEAVRIENQWLETDNRRLQEQLSASAVSDRADAGTGTNKEAGWDRGEECQVSGRELQSSAAVRERTM